MESEDFDMKARNANKDTFPPFENGAWDKMEFLLDQHLPQKKDKRRFFFWWLAALIPIGLVAGYFLMYNTVHSPDETQGKINDKKEKNNSDTSIKIVTPEKNMKATDQSDVSVSSLSSKITKEEKQITDRTDLLQKPDQTNQFSVKRPAKKSYGKQITTGTRNGDIETVFQNSTANNNNDIVAAPRNDVSKNENKEKITINNVTSAKDTLVTKEKIPDTFSKADIKKKKSKDQFYITFSSGIESSGTGIDKLGTSKPVYGAGLQYSRSKIFLRAGLLVTKKIYTAKDKDYNRKSGTWMSNVMFDNIVANCKVIEIPVSIGYTLINNKKSAVYITAGTSAYFMKKEDYQFYFKNTSGNDTTRNANFTNNSSHYFSSINLSAGIEKKISNRLSLTAEPTIKIPVSGIGFGKIKLYGAGVLVTAKIRLK